MKPLKFNTVIELENELAQLRKAGAITDNTRVSVLLSRNGDVTEHVKPALQLTNYALVFKSAQKP